MAELTFKLWLDEEMTRPLQVVNGKPRLSLNFNNVQDLIFPLWLGSNAVNRVLDRQVGNTDTHIKIGIGEAAQGWQAGMAVTAGRIVQPENGFMYRTRNGGATGTVQPVWPMAPDTGIDDGSVRWVNTGRAFDQSFFGLALSEAAAQTSTAQVVNIAPTLPSGAAVVIWVRARNTDAYLRSDESDPILKFEINKVVEKAA